MTFTERFKLLVVCLFVIWWATLLAGCAGRSRPVVVDPPPRQAAPCATHEVREPVYPDTGDDIFTKVRALLAELELRKGYEAELKKVASASCR